MFIINFLKKIYSYYKFKKRLKTLRDRDPFIYK